jgi:ribonuclease Z
VNQKGKDQMKILPSQPSNRTSCARSGLWLLGLSALACGALATHAQLTVGGPREMSPGRGNPKDTPGNCYPTHYHTDRFSYFKDLREFDPHTPLETNEMRISFMGSVVPPFGRAQRMMSIYVEVGWELDAYANANPANPPGTPPAYQPKDQFVFDCGPGTLGNYISMNVPFHRLNKIFITHLHGDHMGELPAMYGLIASGRMKPLFVFGQSPSGVLNPGDYPPINGYPLPNPPRYSASPTNYNDGVGEFCRLFREANRWQTEAFSFQATSYRSYVRPTMESWGLPHPPLPVGDDPDDDAFALIPIEFPYDSVGVAYDNASTGAKITHYPVVHCRRGSMGYKLAWTPPGAARPLTMIYSSDTKPEWNSVEQAANGGEPVDVFIHEMAVPPEVWAMKMQGLTSPDQISPAAKEYTETVQDSSHTAPSAFGYLLSQIRDRTGGKLPRLTVATHFPTSDDTVACAFKSVGAYIPNLGKLGEKLTWSYDCMIIRVFPDRIEQRRAQVADYTYFPTPSYSFYDPLPAKYHDATGQGNPFAQIDTNHVIWSTQDGGYNGQPTYDKSGY